MIKAIAADKNSTVVNIEESNGKNMTVCSSSIKSDFFSPRQLVQSALAGCLTMSIRHEFRENGIDFENLEVFVDMAEPKEGDDKAVFEVFITVSSDADPELLKACKDKAKKECFISNLLSKGINIVETSEMINTKAGFEECCK